MGGAVGDGGNVGRGENRWGCRLFTSKEPPDIRSVTSTPLRVPGEAQRLDESHIGNV